MILALSSKTALRSLKCPWGVQVVNLINHLLPGSLLLLLLQGHFRQGSLKYSSREREEVGFDLSFLREIRDITNVGVVVILLRKIRRRTCPKCPTLRCSRSEYVFGPFLVDILGRFRTIFCICAGQRPSKEKSEDFMLPDLLSVGNVLDWWHESKDQGFKSAVRCEFRRCFRESHIGCCAVQI